MLGDFTKQIARDYGVLNEEKGFAWRGTFLIDPKGVVQAEIVNAAPVGRNVEEILRTIDAFQAGGLCPANWKPGEKLLNK